MVCCCLWVWVLLRLMVWLLGGCGFTRYIFGVIYVYIYIYTRIYSATYSTYILRLSESASKSLHKLHTFVLGSSACTVYPLDTSVPL